MRVKINKQNLMNKKSGLSYLQILMLVISTFAFSYLVYSLTETASAQTENFACCEKTVDGEYCQFVPEENCSDDFRKVPKLCEETEFCEPGCCYSPNTGWCNERTPERSCNGIWEEDPLCNIAECHRGCCVLGNNAIWATERECEVKAGFYGLETEFRPDVNSELECIFLTERDDEGACVLSDTCKFTTRESCESMNGYFYENIFCSDDGLGTDCQAQDHVGCAENENGDGQSAYWFDSCGNKEEVKEECSIFAGTMCALVDEDFTCRSINCEVDGRTRKNGESWCEYDGTIGKGRDPVGSRHVKHICFMGEERIEPCQDYRNQICVGSETDGFSEAACRINNWRSCFDYNMDEDYSQEKMGEKCQENPDCTVQGVHIDKFSFDMCVPDSPPGFDLSNEVGGKNSELSCGMASQSCTVIYVKKLSGWKCKVNCGCEDSGFTQQMNDLCTSLGDCGGYVNYAGEATDDGYTSGAGKINLNQYKKYAQPNPNQEPAEPGNLSFLGRLGISQGSYDGGSKLKGLGVYGVGFALQVASWEIAALASGIQTGISASGLQASASLAAGQGGATSGSIGAFGNALAGAGAVMISASIMSMAFGIDYKTGLIISAAGGIAYAISAGATTISGVLTILSKLVPYLLIIYAILKLLGIGKTKKKVISFQCLPWQPPTGGKDCEKCNTNDPLDVPCSDYRCQSLGQTCELINKGTEQELCIDNSPTDVSSPRISPLYGVISEGYEYYNIQNNGFEVTESGGSCIPEFTPVTFGIETDKPAQCKIGTGAMMTYDVMEEYFGGSNLYLIEHTSLLNIPSPAAFANQYNLTDEQIAALGEINFYVKCKSVNGVVNTASYAIRTCVKPGPDLTAPRITYATPANGAYVKYNATQQDLTVWVNEPAECKWSVDNKAYENMENSMNCQKELEDYGLWGWPCNTTLTSIDTNSRFYVKCQDKSKNQNTMTQSYVYELSRSEFELKIEEIIPDEDIISGVEPVTISPEVETSGGAENGKAICEWEEKERGWSDFFTETDSTYHKYPALPLYGGNYEFYVKCEDAAGNIAEDSVEFRVYVDTNAPVITRAYYDGSLKIMTNEDAVCAYSFTDSKCKFDIENATQMSGQGKEHSTGWQTDETYYIKCEDVYGRKPGRCSIIIRPYDIT